MHSGPLAGGRETILIAEDDEDVRMTVADMLADLGYRVLKARDAQSALAIVESGAQVDVLFTDVVMPGDLRSPELARKARERLPDIKVLFTSGYTDNAIVHGGRLDDGVDLLSKPYTKEALARKLRLVIGTSAEASDIQRSPSEPTPAKDEGLGILLVEDEPLIRMAAEDMLVSCGHRVCSAGDATEALQRFDGAGDFEVAIVDLGLPGMEGHVLAARLLSIRPSLAIIFASGADQLPPDTDAAVASRARILRKPYSEADLEAAVAEARTRR